MGLDLPVDCIVGLAPGRSLTVAGVNARSFVAALQEAQERRRGLLLVDTAGAGSPAAIVDHVLDDLAHLAMLRWPHWYGGPALHDDPDGGRSGPWRRAAARCVARGRPPRFRRAAPAFEFEQLARAVDPDLPIFVAQVDPWDPGHAAVLIHAMEWCVGKGASVVFVLPAMPPPVPPFDRILHGVVGLAPARPPVEARFVPPPGRAHPASETEKRVEAALRRDAELGPLFRGNEAIVIDGYGAPRVDFLWREGKVVVELDGPDHQGDVKFAADRHRDYELLVAGYLVLRLTNAQVETDLAHAVAKIRRVVQFRRGTREGS